MEGVSFHVLDPNSRVRSTARLDAAGGDGHGSGFGASMVDDDKEDKSS